LRRFTAGQCTLTNIQQPKTVTGNFSTTTLPPGAPLNVVASLDDAYPGRVWLSFTPPGDPSTFIDHYTVTSNPGNLDFYCYRSPCDVTVSNNGSSYRFTVSGHNSGGKGPASELSNSETPKQSQSIGALSFRANVVAVQGTVSAVATATSGLPVTLTSLTPSTCAVSSQTVTGLSDGTCRITASQTGNETYLSANQVDRTLQVSSVPGANVRLVNLSTRGRVDAGNKVMIGGFVIGGTSPKSVLVRAVGPTLAAFGVSDVFANPNLTLYSGQTVIASNDNWFSASNAAAIQATGLAPASYWESAILMTLQPGAYTALMGGAFGDTGVGIVEVFAQ
jgi:hypothetical protein